MLSLQQLSDQLNRDRLARAEQRRLARRRSGHRPGHWQAGQPRSGGVSPVRQSGTDDHLAASHPPPGELAG
jgi:hypothetical protein